jgi:hypothetical protein
MKVFVLMSLFTSAVFVVSATASRSFSIGSTMTEQVAHGGGCRKDSPQGQCCHAGSKPYHCH